MAVTEQREPDRAPASGEPLGGLLAAIASLLAGAARADVVLVRTLDGARGLVARTVITHDEALAGELEGSRLDPGELPASPLDQLDAAPAAVRRAAMLAGADVLLLLPVRLGGEPVASLELLRAHEPFRDEERLAARVAAAQIELAVRSLPETGTRGLDRDGLLGLVGDALVVGADETGAAEQITRLAAEATGAIGALLWRLERGSGHVLVATHAVPVGAELGHAAAAVARAGGGRISVELDEVDGVRCAILQLGRPWAGALQLFFAAEASLDEARLARLATFGVRAAHALRANERARTLAVELDQTRALLTVLGQAIAQLSLTHTLDTAVERIAELLGVERVAVYLSEDGRLTPAAGRGLGGPHLRVAERLFELILGPLRSRGVLAIEDAAGDPLLAPAATAVAETGIELALAVPLLVPEEAIGLLVVYPPAGRGISANESALLSAMGSQLAVAVQNARLHERAKSLGNELEAALASERQAAKRLRSLYEISRSFAQSLSLETTLQAVVSSVVELLGVDAAVIRMPDKRRELLEARAIHVADPALGPAIETILSRPQPFAILSTQRLFRSAGPVALDPEGAELLGAAHALLVPFLEKGSTAAVVPLATPAEVLGTLTILSLAPGRPIDDETVESAASLAGQAALAIDNARLYQQQKEFSDTMQRSLLPRSHPELDGLELGEVYESSAHVEVGGDVYDFLMLADGRLAVVLGDVTGHGIEAAADMAMAKFVFRTLAREHPEPGDFLAQANEVVVGEIQPGKFITMVYVTIDPSTGELACAGGGHPPPRLVEPDGRVRSVDARGLALGVDGDQVYVEVQERLQAGASLVLYTDGVIEARRNHELYGQERLDALLATRAGLAPAALARAVVDDCRAWNDGELSDDCAVVVIKRTG